MPVTPKSPHFSAVFGDCLCELCERWNEHDIMSDAIKKALTDLSRSPTDLDRVTDQLRQSLPRDTD